MENEVVWYKANEKYSVDHAYANKTSRTAFCILAVSVGELITEVARTEMQTRAYAHHVASSLPVSKEILAKPKFRLKSGLIFHIINENIIAYDMFHESYARNKIERLGKKYFT